MDTIDILTSILAMLLGTLAAVVRGVCEVRQIDAKMLAQLGEAKPKQRQFNPPYIYAGLYKKEIDT